jgi:hypothetical protein
MLSQYRSKIRYVIFVTESRNEHRAQCSPMSCGYLGLPPVPSNR